MARARPPVSSSGGSGGSSSVLRFMNRSLTVLRGTTANAYGDLSDVGQPLYTGIQAAIAETSDVVFDAATQRQQTIRAITCIVPGWADILDTDTLFDPFTGWYYLIEGMQQEPGLGYYPPRKVLTLRMRSGVTVGSD